MEKHWAKCGISHHCCGLYFFFNWCFWVRNIIFYFCLCLPYSFPFLLTSVGFSTFSVMMLRSAYAAEQWGLHLSCSDVISSFISCYCATFGMEIKHFVDVTMDFLFVFFLIIKPLIKPLLCLWVCHSILNQIHVLYSIYKKQWVTDSHSNSTEVRPQLFYPLCLCVYVETQWKLSFLNVLFLLLFHTHTIIGSLFKFIII